jgi:hypothetical protein
MPTPRNPRTRKPANTMQIDRVPVAPTRRRPARTPPTYVGDPRQPVQHIPRDADWVTTQSLRPPSRNSRRSRSQMLPRSSGPRSRASRLMPRRWHAWWCSVYSTWAWSFTTIWRSRPIRPHQAGSLRQAPEAYGHRGRIGSSPRATQACDRHGGQGGCARCPWACLRRAGIALSVGVCRPCTTRPTDNLRKPSSGSRSPLI